MKTAINLKYVGSVSRSEPDENAFDQFVLVSHGAVERNELLEVAVVARCPFSFIWALQRKNLFHWFEIIEIHFS